MGDNRQGVTPALEIEAGGMWVARGMREAQARVRKNEKWWEGLAIKATAILFIPHLKGRRQVC